MKKVILIILSILLVFMIALAVFWEPIIDALPIDQSGWKVESEVHYYLDEDGDPIVGWQEIEGYQYYFDPDNGAMHTGWLELGGARYHFDVDGRMLSDCWVQDEQGNHYLRTDGAMATGWLDDGSTRYYLSEEGTPVTGWQEIDGARCYFSENGTLLTGWQDIDGERYYFNEDGSARTGWLETDDGRYYLNEDGVMQTGWIETNEGRFYLSEDGTPASGWQEIDGSFYRFNEDGSVYSGWLELDEGRYYIQEDGTPHLGWLELDGNNYYLKPDTGTAAVGKLVIDEKTYYFTSTGANIILVNPWNYIPDDYEVELVTLDDGRKVAAEMYEALMQMLADCEAAGHKPYLRSAYRTHADQQANFNRILEKYNYNRTKAAQVVAVPGTSEHQLGLAVDITDNSYRDLDYDQEKTETQQWLMEHCWEYGFILRYPNEKSAITGIIYEPWHYRYVGTELSREIKELGLCLEEYIDMLTNDGTTCGGT